MIIKLIGDIRSVEYWNVPVIFLEAVSRLMSGSSKILRPASGCSGAIVDAIAGCNAIWVLKQVTLPVPMLGHDMNSGQAKLYQCGTAT